jgi:ankyrin repeat protein
MGGAAVLVLTALAGLSTAVALAPSFRARVELWRRGVSLGDPVTAVHAASRVDDVETLELLRTATADLSVLDVEGNSALHTAIASNAHDAAEFLLAAGVDGSGSDEPPLALALRSGDPEMARTLLARGADPNQPDAQGFTPLARAVAEHDQKTARMLLASGASPDVDPPGPDASVLEHAVREGWADLVTLLVTRGANTALLGREGQPMLPLAVALGRADVTEALLDAGVDIETPLVTPVSEDFMALVPGKYARHFLTRDEGITPLMVAVLRGDREVARLLRDRRASLGPTRTLVKYPLGMAANRKDIPMMQVLLGRDPAEAAKSRHIVVSLSQQKATLYEQDKPTLETRVSTGRKGFRTPTGEYVITNKHRKWTSTLYEAEMPYFLRLSGGDFGLHQGVVPRGPASHGCIRVPAGTAKRLYDRMRLGDPVTITQ